MPKLSWLEAAEKYNRHSPAAKKQEEDALVHQIARELQQFLDSPEGQAALELLKASGRHIILAEERDGAHGTVYFLDGEGLRKSHEAMGMWTAYANPQEGHVRSPRVLPLEAREAVEVVKHDRQPLVELIACIRRDLDNIAAEAPSSP
ncbi:MAG: hypothetical protein UX57_C0009G0033 [Candidatus Uhrbacteria bacterium GW2011_GWE2_46_68]|uniref:Uncharacterized protein n=2 Tax=Candidatus Uhriibacteriota TaxID=1752732 RepID=A0A0G1Q732_9BACT|nr:MAG: hypothetical protein UX45_C0006G0033 [Candidatus Uhrbacteria bacterium GW2011_GWF2_46_218]KKU40866.1 MAG: hypothetical protein UX57_C0009G0033 [Candidatus Uhrbacteria bacterium GW2011_GWE2_46_68]